jgi:hypothetical protein
MPDYDAGFKIVARAAGPALGELAGLHCDEWEPIGGEVHATERLADRAFRVRQRRERFIVYVEAYTRWTKAAPWSVLAKSALLAERERLPVLNAIFVLLPRGYRSPQGQFRLEIGGSPTLQVWFREICLWEQKPAEWWEETPGLMPLFPLCRHRLPRRVAIERAAAMITDHTRDRIQRATLLTTLGIFGRLVYRDLPVMDLIGREAMKESPFYQEIAAATARGAVEKVLEVRFGSKAVEEFHAVLESIGDEERLTELVGVAAQSRRIADFRRALMSATTVP